MSPSRPDKSILSPANWTDTGTTLALSLFLAIVAMLYVLADSSARSSFGLFSFSLLSFLGITLFLISSTKTRAVSELVVGIGCLMMLAFIAVFSVVVNGPNAFILLLLLVPVSYAALNGNPLGTGVVILLSALLWLLLNLSLWWPQPALLAPLAVSTLPLLLVGVLVHLLSREVVYAQTKITSMAELDSLTGLLNRETFARLVQDEIHIAFQRETNFAILYIDVDNLNAINTEHGRDQGDKVLIAITESIARSVRQEDRVARFGGDEFAVFLAFASDKTSNDVTNRVRQNIYNMTLSFERRTERVQVSVGIAIYPESGATISDLLQFAEEAMLRDRSFRQHQKTNTDIREQAGLQTKDKD